MDFKVEKIPRKNFNGFRKGRSTLTQIFTIHRIIEWVRAKNLEATLRPVDFSGAFDSICNVMMEKILLAYDLPKETDTVIMIFD